ncbi:hypothetical protein N9920_00585 [Akkermansiaceae bacterium]|nr:hypothetical protein [Akkermansiaceae bacterium]
MKNSEILVIVIIFGFFLVALVLGEIGGRSWDKKYVKAQAEAKKEAEEAEKEAKKEAKKEAEKEARVRARRALIQKYEDALNFSTYELAEIVISLVDSNSYDKLKEVASVLTDPTHIDEVLSDASKMLSEGYEGALKESAATRCADINYQEKLVSKKLASLVASCVAIGRGAIGKKIGVVVSAVDSSAAKSEIRKTKKWED